MLICCIMRGVDSLGRQLPVRLPALRLPLLLPCLAMAGPCPPLCDAADDGLPPITGFLNGL